MTQIQYAQTLSSLKVICIKYSAKFVFDAKASAEKLTVLQSGMGGDKLAWQFPSRGEEKSPSETKIVCDKSYS